MPQQDPHAPDATPASLGFRMPAEWEPHAATWLTWPHNLDSWPGKFEPVPDIWVRMVAALAPGERVEILVRDEAMRAAVEARLRATGVPAARRRLHVIPSNDAWMRDHGPTFVVRDHGDGRELGGIDWDYNAWGGKYPPFDLDATIAAQVCALTRARRFAPGIVLEGGSIEVNGRGTLLTTESCLLNRNRNPELSRAQIEGVLRDHLGVRHILWLGDGIVGDDTDGHIDDITRFVDASTVVTVLEDDPRDANHEPLRENAARLRELRDQDGRPLQIVELPMPAPVEFDGQRLPASYANFYIGNRVVLTPVFDDPNDARALATLQGCFPDREVVGIAAVDMVLGLGAFHCVTQQQPASMNRW